MRHSRTGAPAWLSEGRSLTKRRILPWIWLIGLLVVSCGDAPPASTPYYLGLKPELKDESGLVRA